MTAAPTPDTAAPAAPPVPDISTLPLMDSSNMARHAFWTMTRRVTLVAACVDLAFLALFLWFDSPLLAWVNVLSIAMYLVAYWLLTLRINNPALILIWLEVLGHAALGSLVAGWDSGFHYYLLLFIPAIVVSWRGNFSALLVILLLVFYLVLHTCSRTVGAVAPLSPVSLMVVHAFNVSIVFGMSFYVARIYYGAVRRAEKSLKPMPCWTR
jgi:diguanylate cyclase